MNTILKLSKKFSETEESLKTSSYESEAIPTEEPSQEKDPLLNEKENTKLGTYVEGYFYLKLKKYFKAEYSFRGNYSIISHYNKLKDSVLNYIKKQGNSDEMKIAAVNLIQMAEEIFKNESTNIQIDSFFPNVSGKMVKTFYDNVSQYTYSSSNFRETIKDGEYYNLVIESTHNIISVLNKKGKQLRNYLTIFSKTKNLYLANKDMLEEFYLGFLKNFDIVGKEVLNISANELEKKSNFIYIICSNKNYMDTKLFQESLKDIEGENFKRLIQKLEEFKDSDINVNKKDKKKTKNKKENKNEIKIKNKEIEDADKSDEIKENNGAGNDDQKKEDGNDKENEGVASVVNESLEQSIRKKSVKDFKETLNQIEEEKEPFLLVYLDSYDKLFIPYDVIRDGITELKEMNESIKTMNEAMNQKLIKVQKDNESIKQDYEFLKKAFRKYHPDLFDENGEFKKDKNI